MPGFPKGSVARVGLGVCALLALLLGLEAVDRGGAGAQRVSPAPPAAEPRATSTTELAADEGVTGSHENETSPPLERRTTSLGRGGTLGASLERLGVAPGDRDRVARALGRELDLTRLPAATGLSASMDAQGDLQRLAVRTEPGSFARWRCSAGEPTVEIVELPVRASVRQAGGQVVHSVHQALEDSPWAEALTLAFVDVFQWDIDFLVEPRTGDRLRVVYEVEVLGDVPSDLPPFGNSPCSPGEPLRLGRVLAASYDGLVARSTAFWVDGAGGYYDASGAPLRKTFLKSPLNYRRISSSFSHGRRHPITRKVVPHHGVDFAAAAGTPVVAAADGNVVSTGWQGALGRTVRIRHGSDYTTVYGHLRGFATGIRPGTTVRQNQVIGFVGSTGRATGPHLHYTMLHRNRAIDPMAFRNPPAEALAEELLPRLKRAKRNWSPLLDREVLTAAGADALPIESAPTRRGV